ncbi:MAG: DsbC family protein [Syntrophales bacterium]
MHVRTKAVLVICILLAIASGTPLQAATPEESFRKNFPDIPLESINPTEISGLYEIIAGGRVAYYIPGKEYLFVGNMISKERKNITEERNNEILTARIKSLPVEKAVKIGNGPRTVIEITDPDCPFCRKASEYFAKRTDVTRYVFLYPISSIHPKAEAKIRYIFCAQDKAKAYEEAMGGKLDDMKFTTCEDPGAAELAKIHRELGDKVGIPGIGTPLFVIDGQVVRGANIPQMDQILGVKK